MTSWFDMFQSAAVAWLIVATAGILLLMWPGYIILYSGLSSRRDVAEQSGRWLSLLAVLSVAWVLWMYSLAFAPSYGTVPESTEEAPPALGTFQEEMAAAEEKVDTSEEQGRGGIIGSGEYLMLRGLSPLAAYPRSLFLARRGNEHVPLTLFVMFQLAVFVVATGPLTVVASRMLRWRSVVVFVVLWGTVVYAPLVHWLWGDGWLKEYGALDQSGGLIHIGIGFSALVCVVMSPRRNRPGDAPDAAAATLGSAMLWVGALLLHTALTFRADGHAAVACLNTHLAAAGGVMGWIAAARFTGTQAHQPWFVLGGVAGLVAIAPGCSLIMPQSSLIVGLIAGAVASLARTHWCAEKLNDPGVGVFVIHGLSGVIGMLLTGVFVTTNMAGLDRHGQVIEGLVGGDPTRVLRQGAAIAAVAALAVLGTGLLLLIVRLLNGKFPPGDMETTSVPE